MVNCFGSVNCSKTLKTLVTFQCSFYYPYLPIFKMFQQDLVALAEQMAAGAMEDCALKAFSKEKKESLERLI